MKLKHILVLLAVSFAVAACGSNRKDDPNANSTTNLGKPNPNSSWTDFTNSSRNGYSDRVLFDYDSSEVRQDQVATLQAWAEWLKAHGGAQIMVEGHCDERGTREYNLGLGAKRATFGQELPGFARHSGQPHPHRVLRPGTPGRGRIG